MIIQQLPPPHYFFNISTPMLLNDGAGKKVPPTSPDVYIVYEVNTFFLLKKMKKI